MPMISNLPVVEATWAHWRSSTLRSPALGRPARDTRGLAAATRGVAGTDPVPVVVFRDGQEITLQVNPGRLGVFGRGVEAQEPK